jgi:branched-subunit amino acid transport protein
MSDWLLIVGMTVLTFVPRYIPFGLAGKVTIPPLMSQALSYVPIAVLTVIIVQTTLIRDGEVVLTIQNHHLIAAIVAFFVSLITKHQFLAIGLGLVSFLIMKWM